MFRSGMVLVMLPGVPAPGDGAGATAALVLLLPCRLCARWSRLTGKRQGHNCRVLEGQLGTCHGVPRLSPGLWWHMPCGSATATLSIAKIGRAHV